MITLQNRVAIVSGASRGIGKEIALQLARAGAQLVLCYRKESESSMDLQRQLQEMNAKYERVLADLEDLETPARLVKHTIERFGKLDILINNAGVLKPNLIAMTQDEDWAQTLEVNLTAPMRLVRACIPLLLKSPAGRVINIGSTASIIPFVGQGAYGVSKGGLQVLTQVLAKELARRKVTVNCVAPGFVETDMSGPYTEYQEQIPLKRFGKPEEVASLVLYLTTDQAAYITGQVLVVDGGFTI